MYLDKAEETCTMFTVYFVRTHRAVVANRAPRVKEEKQDLKLQWIMMRGKNVRELCVRRWWLMESEVHEKCILQMIISILTTC